MSLMLSDLEVWRGPPDPALLAEIRGLLDARHLELHPSPAMLAHREGDFPPFYCGKWFPALNCPSPCEEMGLRDASFVCLGQGRAQTLSTPFVGLIND